MSDPSGSTAVGEVEPKDVQFNVRITESEERDLIRRNGLWQAETRVKSTPQDYVRFVLWPNGVPS